MDSIDGGDVALAQRAASGDAAARKRIAELADPIAKMRAAKYCKRFCGRNRREYVCTIDPAYGVRRHDAAQCEWGSFSYYFFFDALAGERTLSRFEGRDGTTLERYFRAVAGSLGLWERWKNRRFQRRVYVPKAVENLGKDAVMVYYGLRDRDSVANIAQRIGGDEKKADALAHTIGRVLALERRSYQMIDRSEVSWPTFAAADDEDAEESSWEPPSYDEPVEHVQILERLRTVLPQLSWLEQFIVQSMVMENISAEDTLQALRDESVEIKPGLSAREANINQIYYLRDKTLAKVRRMCNV